MNRPGSLGHRGESGWRQDAPPPGPRTAPSHTGKDTRPHTHATLRHCTPQRTFGVMFRGWPWVRASWARWPHRQGSLAIRAPRPEPRGFYPHPSPRTAWGSQPHGVGEGPGRPALSPGAPREPEAGLWVADGTVGPAPASCPALRSSPGSSAAQQPTLGKFTALPGPSEPRCPVWEAGLVKTPTCARLAHAWRGASAQSPVGQSCWVRRWGDQQREHLAGCPWPWPWLCIFGHDTMGTLRVRRWGGAGGSEGHSPALSWGLM